MADIAVGDKVLVTFVGRCYGQRIMNTFGFTVSNVSAVTDITSALQELRGGLVAAYGYVIPWLACMPTSYVLVETWIQVVGPVRYRKAVFTDNLDGIYDVPTTTANLAGVITRQAEPAGRRYQSPLHLLLPTEAAAVSQGELTPETLENYQDMCDKIVTFTGLVGGDVTFTPCIPHPLYVPAPQPWSPIVAANPQTTARVMRRRTLGVGI